MSLLADWEYQWQSLSGTEHTEPENYNDEQAKTEKLLMTFMPGSNVQ